MFSRTSICRKRLLRNIVYCEFKSNVRSVRIMKSESITFLEAFALASMNSMGFSFKPLYKHPSDGFK